MNDDLERRLAALEARLDAVERRPPEKVTMKERRRCTSCGCAKLLHTADLRADIRAGVPFGVSTHVPAFGRVRTRGTFEVFACTDCGLVEWHVLGVDASILDDARLTLIEPDDEPETPYR